MFKVKAMACLLVVSFLMGCAGTMKVTTDSDPSAKFSNLRTFDWYSSSQKSTGDARIDNPLLDARIRKIVEEELALRGYEKVTDGSADFYLHYTLVVNEKTSVESVDGYYGYAAPAWQYGHGYYSGQQGYGTAATEVYTYEMGSLILDILQADNQKLIWRGSAQAQIKESPTPEQSSQRITAAVKKMLDKFPPQ